MKVFSDTTVAFPAAKGAFELVLVNLQSVFSEILISQSQLVNCGNMVRDQSLDCEKPQKIKCNSEKVIQEEMDFLL